MVREFAILMFSPRIIALVAGFACQAVGHVTLAALWQARERTRESPNDTTNKSARFSFAIAWNAIVARNPRPICVWTSSR